MENPTCFDLNAAIETWQRELAAQTNLTADVRRELQTHVRDVVAELQRHGLNDEESFWLARRRVGQPYELEKEFANADAVAAWREKVLWIAASAFGLLLWQMLTQALALHMAMVRGAQYTHGFDWHFTVISLYLLPTVGLAVSVGLGHFFKKPAAWFSSLRSRRRFFFVACFLITIVNCFANELGRGQYPLGSNDLYAAVFICLIAWLLPQERSLCSA